MFKKIVLAAVSVAALAAGAAAPSVAAEKEFRIGILGAKMKPTVCAISSA